jgi:transcriptional regulator with XRE-family HTH domain
MPYLANLERGRGNPTFEVLTRIAKAAGVDLATLLGTETPVEGIDLALATLPRSLRDFPLTDEFKARTKILAEDQGRPPDEMRAAILAGMAAAPQRSSGEATITDWRRLFDAFARNLT